MNCGACGQSVSDYALICWRCGRPTNSAATPAPDGAPAASTSPAPAPVSAAEAIAPPASAPHAAPTGALPVDVLADDAGGRSEHVVPSNREAFQSEAGGEAARRRSFPVDVSIVASYKHAWRQLWRHFPALLIISCVFAVISVLINVALPELAVRLDPPDVAIFSTLTALVVSVFVSPPLSFGTAYVFLRTARDERPQVADLFVAFRRAYLPSIGASLLLGLATLTAMLLFIVPGLIVGMRLSLVPYLMLDESLGPTEAISESWRRTRGHFWRMFGTGVLAIPILLIGLLFFLVGFIPAMLLANLAMATLAAAVTAQDERRRLRDQLGW